MSAEAPQLPRLIKRYANRKLYDTVQGAFTSLAHIKKLVRDGVEVVVLDHGTGTDMTAEVLSLTLSRRGRGDGPAEYDGPDVALLAQLIRSPERLVEAVGHGDYDTKGIRRLRDEVQALSDTLDRLLAPSPEAKDTEGSNDAEPRDDRHDP